MKLKVLTYILASTCCISSCTKLDETLHSTVSTGGIGSNNVDALLKGAYNAMRVPYQQQDGVWALQEHSTDECLGPTRGGDWDDNGIWRVLHAHKWTADHAYVNNTFNNLGGVVFSSTDLLQYSPSASQAAQARFLRAFAMFDILDIWNQVPYRDPGESTVGASRVRKGSEALDYIMSELNAIIKDLPDGPPANQANKDAARVLLMKCYLNKGVIANRAAPTFDNADMAQVITLADQIITSGRYKFSTDYFDNFAPDNDTKSTENIFTANNVGGAEGGDVRSRWYMGLHYNQNPSGWNGFTTLSDFYNKFDAADKRRGESYPGMTDKSGIKAGFLIGQQYDQTGKALTDRKGHPLAFTAAVKIKETDPNTLEFTGIRVMKYTIDYASSDGTFANNDYVFYRYSDVLLMKAEAMLRSGNAAGGLTLVNQVRAARNVTPFASLTLDNLLDELGREFYFECHRRTDLIRFGKFLDPWQEKDGTDDPKYLIYPIPNRQLAVNPNLEQNPGY
ncbi:RagB/SusD family nutrient uptake outer membrane protein [Danxiaibacter flavus]|uniref:RagB/SusD family nutrient uptake outer membrane protein n=1 Tax=Danxiaibacter flavus TaxID=3049108 RepID=A0ABV3ZFW2_9BACT|nr:RagB/SusD family nutrient uptake outer membrane protein [Chitinophagaceae bacterium DXS]